MSTRYNKIQNVENCTYALVAKIQYVEEYPLIKVCNM